MNLTGLHFLLTYQCTFECDHCFVWGSPFAKGTFTLKQIETIYEQALELGTIESIYFEGGEPFLYYPIMVKAIEKAKEKGFSVGIVTNGYWATSIDDAMEWLRPLVQFDINDLSISDDELHYESKESLAKNALEAGRILGFPVDNITIVNPKDCIVIEKQNKGEAIVGGEVRFKGRAVDKLTEGVKRKPWLEFQECPYEDLVNPSRVHIDSFGYVHLCQGLAMGNLWETPLVELIKNYNPSEHPICSALIKGGPVALVEKYNLPHETTYIDACHLCYLSRNMLREKFPQYLAPGQMYGEKQQ